MWVVTEFSSHSHTERPVVGESVRQDRRIDDDQLPVIRPFVGESRERRPSVEPLRGMPARAAEAARRTGFTMLSGVDGSLRGYLSDPAVTAASPLDEVRFGPVRPAGLD